MTERSDWGPAFPTGTNSNPHNPGPPIDNGQPLNAYAAIHLRVPRSGNPELDQMIREARRLELAGVALAGMLANTERVLASLSAAETRGVHVLIHTAEVCTEHADALLSQLEPDNGAAE